MEQCMHCGHFIFAVHVDLSGKRSLLIAYCPAHAETAMDLGRDGLSPAARRHGQGAVPCWRYSTQTTVAARQ